MPSVAAAYNPYKKNNTKKKDISSDAEYKPVNDDTSPMELCKTEGKENLHNEVSTTSKFHDNPHEGNVINDGNDNKPTDPQDDLNIISGDDDKKKENDVKMDDVGANLKETQEEKMLHPCHLPEKKNLENKQAGNAQLSSDSDMVENAGNQSEGAQKEISLTIEGLEEKKIDEGIKDAEILILSKEFESKISPIKEKAEVLGN